MQAIYDLRSYTLTSSFTNFSGYPSLPGGIACYTKCITIKIQPYLSKSKTDSKSRISCFLGKQAGVRVFGLVRQVCFNVAPVLHIIEERKESLHVSMGLAIGSALKTLSTAKSMLGWIILRLYLDREPSGKEPPTPWPARQTTEVDGSTTQISL